MAVAFGATASTSGSSITSLTWSVAVSGTNTCVVIGSSTRNGSATGTTSATIGGTTATKAGSGFVSGSLIDTSLFYLAGVATGTITCTASYPASTTAVAGACSFNGVSQTAPVSGFQTANATSTATSVTIASSSTSMVMDNVCPLFTPTVNAAQTQRWNTTQGSDIGASSTITGAASVAMRWSMAASVAWVTCGVSIDAPAVPNNPTCWNDSLWPVYGADWKKGRFQKLARDFYDWQRVPLSADALLPTPSMYVVVPPGKRKFDFYSYSQQNVGGDSLPEARPQPQDVPRGVRKHEYTGVQRSPLSADSLPEIRQQPFDVPSTRKWLKHDMAGWQQSPSPAAILNPVIVATGVFDLPVRARKPLVIDWTVQPLPAEYLVPLPWLDFERGRSRFPSYAGFQSVPLPDEYLVPQPSTDLPIRAKNSYNNAVWLQGVRPAEYTVPSPQFDLPVARPSSKDFGGWIAVQQSADIPMPSAPFSEVPYTRTARLRSFDFSGNTSAPIPADVIPPTVFRIYMTLMGVGTKGP